MVFLDWPIPAAVVEEVGTLPYLVPVVLEDQAL
jgi:hypothetical protein